MMKASWRLRWFLAGAGMLGVGCAHEQAARVTETPPTAPAAPQAQAPATPASSSAEDDAKALAVGAVLHFDFDEDVLKEDSTERLRQIAPILQAHSTMHVRISGNCDERGTEEYNLALGQRRAEAAKKYLVALGVPAQRIDTLSYGFERPVNKGHDEEAWAANRRDDIDRE